MPIKVESVRASRKKGKPAIQNGVQDSAEIPAIPAKTENGSRERVENAIGDRSVFLTAIVENNPLASVVLDSNNKVQLCNPAFERMFGWRLDEIAGCDVDDFIAPPALATEASDFSRRTLVGESLQATTCRQRMDGTLVDVEVHAAPLMLQGKLAGIFAVYEEITERKRADEQLRAAEARYRQLVEQLP
ncbi:MAG TPA: PAS domain S-box protein, partial [Candidatus Dormibacteraeota bacterium]|nr:PAS domain S-box protein [Candidatus Dormibacteraeota bacterium]